MSARPLPHFLIIGAMKSATSSLYWWLAGQPEIFLAFPKETDFFSIERRWRKGIDWYASLFAEAAPGQLRGEASVSYTSPAHAPVAAARMQDTVPEVRLIYVIRDPIERLRSHYRHEVQRNRERRPLVDALAESGNPYVGHSLYHRCLEPYLRAFREGQICVVRYEDLVHDPHVGWEVVLKHLGLSSRPAPGTVHNRTADHERWTAPLRWMKDKGVVRFSLIRRLPGPIRRLGHRAFMRGGAEFDRQLEASLAEIPDAITAPIWEDVARLEERLGLERSGLADPAIARSSDPGR